MSPLDCNPLTLFIFDWVGFALELSALLLALWAVRKLSAWSEKKEEAPAKRG